MKESLPKERAGLIEAVCHVHSSGAKPLRVVVANQLIYLLKHIERSECITVCEDNTDWLVAFTGSAAAFSMRTALGLTERVDIIEIAAGKSNCTAFLLDGEFSVLRDQTTRPQ